MTTPTTPRPASGVYYRDDTLTLLLGDAVNQLRTVPDGAVHCVVTSPPYYGLRDYAGHREQIGLEETPAAYVARLVDVFTEVHRVLADDGTLWLNLGDSYYSGRGNPGPNSADNKQAARRGWVRPVDRPGQDWAKPKDLLGIPWQVAFALQDAGWYLRNAIVWHKPNAMPESVRDRLATRYELVFLLTKSRRYWFDLDPIREKQATAGERHEGRSCGSGNGWPNPWSAQRRTLNPAGKNPGDVWSIPAVPLPGGKHGTANDTPPGTKPQTNKGATGERHTMTHERGRNPGDVWSIPTTPLPDAHFAAFPVELPRRCILAGCQPGGTVLDPFSGAGTTALAAQQLGHPAIGIDLIAGYHDIALNRMANAPLPLEPGGVA